MEAWQQFLSQLEQELGPEIVKEWVPRVARFDAWNIYLEARDSFQSSWFEEHIRPRLKGLLNNNQRPIKVHFAISGKPSPKKEEGKLSFLPDSLDPVMTLDNFLPAENLVAHQLLSENLSFNPIFLYGPKGVGKTHLLMGAAIALQKKGKKVFFVRAETFTEHVVQAIRLGQMQDFRKVYRDIDALIIDDIHIFSRKNATQEEFFHTFNTLHTSGQLILISANAPPGKLAEIEPRLISRFEWGISLPLQKGNISAILDKKIALWKTSLTADIKEFLLTFTDPIQALTALMLRSENSSLTHPLAERLLKDLVAKDQENALTFEKIVKSVAGHYGITSEDILGKSQMREYALPRQMAMYLCRERLKMPFQKIGEHFHRDHSTVMSSVKQIQKNLEEKKLELPKIDIF